MLPWIRIATRILRVRLHPATAMRLRRRCDIAQKSIALILVCTVTPCRSLCQIYLSRGHLQPILERYRSDIADADAGCKWTLTVTSYVRPVMLLIPAVDNFFYCWLF